MKREELTNIGVTAVKFTLTTLELSVLAEVNNRIKNQEFPISVVLDVKKLCNFIDKLTGDITYKAYIEKELFGDILLPPTVITHLIVDDDGNVLHEGLLSDCRTFLDNTKLICSMVSSYHNYEYLIINEKKAVVFSGSEDECSSALSENTKFFNNCKIIKNKYYSPSKE